MSSAAIGDGVTWIVGASSGIGAALARTLASDGREVVISARSEKALAKLAAGDAKIHPHPLDVTDRAAVAAAVEAIETGHGAIGTAILNAAYYKTMSAADFSAETVEDHVRVNILGVANCIEAVLPLMRRRRRGRLVLTASVNAYNGLPTSLAYGPTKAFILNQAEALRAELDGSGVVVQVICPGFVETPLTADNDFEMPFLMTPDQAARRIADGLRSDRFEIDFPRRFSMILKMIRALPYGLSIPMIRRSTGQK